MKKNFISFMAVTMLLANLSGCSSTTSSTSEETATPETSSTAVSETEYTTDVLVIGGGLAGMQAAITAADSGKEVILLEKMSYLGGAGMISSGAMDSYGSNFESEYGIEDSAELLKSDILAAGDGYNVEWMVDTFVENIGETFDYLVDIGVTFTDPTPSEEHSANRVFLATGGGSAITSAVSDQLNERNVDVHMQTKATSLIVEDSAVTGCVAEDNDGNTITFHADSVILATGGYGANSDLLTDTLANAPYYGFAGSTGDGHIMAEEVGAKLLHMEFGKLYPAGWQYEEGKATIQTGYDNFAFANTSAICITSEGVRAFREGGYNKDFKTAILNDENNLVYMLLDEASYETWREKVLTNTMGNMTTEEKLDSFIEAEGDASQVIYRADTLEELAEISGIDYDTLQATVDRYNSFVENGVDEDFGRTTLDYSIGEGPYTLVAQYLRFATTIGGVEINESYQVINESDEVIEGLYAAGEIVFGVHGSDTIQGTPLGWAMISGTKCAKSIIAE